MKVTKRQVTQFEIQVGNSLAGEGIILNDEEARGLHDELGRALGLPRLDLKGCDDRMSHGSHWWGQNTQHWCGGLSFDRT